MQKIGVVITDGKSTDPELTRKEAQKAHEMGVHMFAIGMTEKT